MNFQVRQAGESDWPDIRDVVIDAFGDGEGTEIANLVADLLAADDAVPCLSLVAVGEDAIAGHILFTNVEISHSPRRVSSSILAPLAVRPEFQRRGIGGSLISEGLRQLKSSGVELVFVLGHPEYYPKHGFTPAGARGFDAPHSIPPENADAWMVQELRPGMIERTTGPVLCADMLNDPRHWQE